MFLIGDLKDFLPQDFLLPLLVRFLYLLNLNHLAAR